MITCEECGCLVDPAEEMLQKHSDWHDKVLVVETKPVANPQRTKWSDLNTLDC